jgi:hypothetical protein
VLKTDLLLDYEISVDLPGKLWGASYMHSSILRRLTVLLAPAFLLAACSSSPKLPKYQDSSALPPRMKWYAHCDTCNWCQGSFKKTQDVQRVVSEHNIQKHDWIKVAYYDLNPCN